MHPVTGLQTEYSLRSRDPEAEILPTTRELGIGFVRSCVRGGDLWPYAQMPTTPEGRHMGHEFLGVVEDVGSDVSGPKAGDLVVEPFLWQDDTCGFCREGVARRAPTPVRTSRTSGV